MSEHKSHTIEQFVALQTLTANLVRNLIRAHLWQHDGECPSDGSIDYRAAIIVASLEPIFGASAVGHGADPSYVEEAIMSVKVAQARILGLKVLRDIRSMGEDPTDAVIGPFAIVKHSCRDN